MKASATILAFAWLGLSSLVHALDRPEVTFQVFQFPRDQIPRIDGDAADWALVPDRYAIRTDQLVDDTGLHPAPDPRTLEVNVRVGWVAGLNRLYFLYEAFDDHWDFAQAGLRNDTLEIVVDGDASGGPLIDKGHRSFWKPERVGQAAATPDDRITVAEAHWAIHGAHAQNYHVFTPAEGKDWCLSWNAASWVKEFPYAHAKCRYEFRSGQRGRFLLEFWITPFDYAGPEGPARAVESVLRENKIIGLGIAVIDYDGGSKNNGFWNLSRQHTMYGHASELCAFRLMPLEPHLLPVLEARWSFVVVDHDRRLVAFKDESVGRSPAVAWKWEFGDGTTSNEQHPLHAFSKPGDYVTTLEVTGTDGSRSRHSKVWDVQLR